MFDALMARTIAAELNGTIAHGRVQAVMSLDALTIGFEIYAQHQRRYLLATAQPNGSRVHLVAEKIRAAGGTPTPFDLLLHKYALGAFINRIAAVPRERILHFEFDHAEQGIATLVVELMGRHANLILLDVEGSILGASKHVTPEMSRARVILPRKKYLPPPPQKKIDPLALTLEELTRLLAERRGLPLWQTLVQTIAGTSPLLGRELAFRAAARADADSDPTYASAIYEGLRQLWNAPADPTIAYADDQPIAVAAFALKHLPQKRHIPSMSAALEEFYGAFESYAAVKEPLNAQLAAARARLERKRASLQREMVAAAEVERLRTSGEMILAHVTEIETGQKKLRAEMLTGEAMEIALDPKLSPVENARKYFAEYRRAREAAASVPARLVEVEADLAFAYQVLVDLENAETREEIDAVIAEARAAELLNDAKLPPTKKSERAVAASQPRVFVSPDGLQILIGRNARQNEEVTFTRARADDLWLHAREFAGAHVVILSNGREVPATTLEFAASLAAFYSSGRAERWVDVAVTPRKNVRKVPGRAARPGLVTVREERTVRVRPALPNETIEA